MTPVTCPLCKQQIRIEVSTHPFTEVVATIQCPTPQCPEEFTLVLTLESPDTASDYPSVAAPGARYYTFEEAP